MSVFHEVLVFLAADTPPAFLFKAANDLTAVIFELRHQRLMMRIYLRTPGDRVKPGRGATAMIRQQKAGEDVPAGFRICSFDRPVAHFIVGIENSAPSLMPEGQREVMVLVRVQNLNESVPCWFKSPKDEDFHPPKEW
jgi:hypothetical protein